MSDLDIKQPPRRGQGGKMKNDVMLLPAKELLAYQLIREVLKSEYEAAFAHPDSWDGAAMTAAKNGRRYTVQLDRYLQLRSIVIRNESGKLVASFHPAGVGRNAWGRGKRPCDCCHQCWLRNAANAAHEVIPKSVGSIRCSVATEGWTNEARTTGFWLWDDNGDRHYVRTETVQLHNRFKAIVAHACNGDLSSLEFFEGEGEAPRRHPSFGSRGGDLFDDTGLMGLNNAKEA